jgi:hypothetical protein
MFAAVAFRNAAPRYPEKVSVYLPKGARAAIERIAEKAGITSPELLRRAIAEKIIPTANEGSTAADAGPNRCGYDPVRGSR